MPYDEELANRLREALAAERVTEKRMFGGLAFLVGGNMAVAVSGQGGLLVRVDPAQTEVLLREPGAEEFDMGRGPVKGWLRVRSDVLDDDAAVQRWVRRGIACARSLPAKKHPAAKRRPPTQRA